MESREQLVLAAECAALVDDRWFKRCLERAGASDFPMHELRHSAGDHLWRRTGNLVLAQQLLRHESIETTRQYLHPTREDIVAGMHLADEEADK